MFPNDAITVHYEISGNTTQNIATGNTPKTVLGVSMQQQNVASDTMLQCGNNVIAKNYATSLTYTPLNYLCNDTLKIVKTGNDNSSVIVTYVPYNLTLTATTTEQVIIVEGGYNGATYHEWLFLGGIIIFIMSFMLWPKLNFFKP